MNRNQKIVTVVSLGILWGISENIIGDLVQSFSLPIRGMVLTIFTIFFLINTKKLAPFNGSIIITGLIAVLLKAVYYQTIFHTALIAVILMAVFAELFFILIKDFKKASISASIFLMIYTYVHAIIAHNYFYGRNIFTQYKNLVYGSWGLNLSIELILLLFLLINVIIGAAAGYFFYKASIVIKKYTNTFYE
ncbi:MAG: hypothetical protein HND52_00530 [Ignavibacteriae bacterium]|nr:hypothetical protein [Ignavibacteriota bacterium]NOG96432.1 hypothetical protein [Ignavibacteriota bacterium]